MSGTLYDLIGSPSLDRPVLVMVLDGWIDAGLAGGTAVQTLLSELDTYPVADFDADQLLDFRARRPVMNLVDGVNEGLTWPGTELRGATDLEGNDMLLLIGAEPDHAWKRFAGEVLDLALELGCRMVVGLGAYPATVPHTRPVTMSVTASTEDLAITSGLLRGSLDVPAGVQAVIERHSADFDLPALGLWAQVPHYVSGEISPYPAAALALLEKLEQVAGLSLPKGELVTEAERTRNRLDAAVATNDDHLNMLRALEERHDEQVAIQGPEAPADLPTADELAAEVERFLRDQGRDG